MRTGRQQEERNRLFGLKSRSISRQLTISLMLIVSLIEGALITIVYTTQQRAHLRELEQQADSYADNLAQVLAVPIWDFDDEQIAKIGSGYIRGDVIDEIRIVDSQGTVLYESRKQASQGGRIARSRDVFHRKQRIGQVDLYLSPRAYTADLVWLRDVILMVLAASLVIIFFTTGLLLRIFMRRPLAVLQRGIDRIAQGDYTHRLNVHHLELAGIAEGFGRMAEVVQARENDLQRLNQELQQEIGERKRAERRIRESEAKSRALLNAIPDMMFRLDRSGTFLEFKGVQEDLYTRPDRFLGRNVDDVLPPELALLLKETLDQALRTRLIQVSEYEMMIAGQP